MLYDHQIGPALGNVPLRDLTTELIARWQSDRLATGAGPVAVNQALGLVGNLLQRAAESGRIASNPARLVLHENRSVIYVARRLGYGAQLTLGTYGHHR